MTVPFVFHIIRFNRLDNEGEPAGSPIFVLMLLPDFLLQSVCEFR